MKISELEDAKLDYWVAKIMGRSDGRDWGIVWNPEECLIYDGEDEIKYSPSTDWSQGGPIIERFGIDTVVQMESAGGIVAEEQRVWGACRDGWVEYWGPTPLIAAMRCFVASKFGEEVLDEVS